MDVVGNLNFRGLTLMKGTPRKQYGQHAVGHGPVKAVLSPVLRAQTQPQQHNYTHTITQHVVSFCMYQVEQILFQYSVIFDNLFC